MEWNQYQLSLFRGNKAKIGELGSAGSKVIQENWENIGNIRKLGGIRKLMKMQNIDNKENSEAKEERGGRIDIYIGNRDYWHYMENRKIQKCMENISDIWKVGKIGE